MPSVVFLIIADNDCNTLINSILYFYSIHKVLRITTLEAGEEPAQGVTFPQPEFILIHFTTLYGRKYCFNIATTTFSVFVAANGYLLVIPIWFVTQS